MESLIAKGGGRDKLLYLTSNLGGGSGNHLVGLLSYQDSLRFEARILSSVKATSRKVPSVPVDVLERSSWFGRYPACQLHELSQVFHHLRSFKPDLVHSYFFWPIIYARLLKFFGLIPSLVENREDQGFNWGQHEYALLRATRSIPDRVICVSQAVCDTVLEKEGLTEERVVVVHNGIEEEQAGVQDAAACRGEVHERFGIAPGEKVVGMIANFNREIKGVSYFVESIPLIIKEVPEARFLLVGKGALEEKLRARAKELEVERFLHFAGYQPDILPYYAAMDVSVLTSLSEGLSITVLESMRAGLPVVATAVGGNPELIVDGQTGFLVPPKDPHAFSRKVVELLKCPDVAKAFGEAGRKRVRECFSLRASSRKYAGVYEQVINKNRENK